MPKEPEDKEADLEKDEPVGDDDTPENEDAEDEEAEGDEPEGDEDDPVRLKEQAKRNAEEANRDKAARGQEMAALKAQNDLLREQLERAGNGKGATDADPNGRAAAIRDAYLQIQSSTDPRDILTRTLIETADQLNQQNADLRRRLDEVPTRARLAEDEEAELDKIAKEHRVSISTAKLIRTGIKAQEAEKDRRKRREELEAVEGKPRETVRGTRTVRRPVSARAVAAKELSADQYRREMGKRDDAGKRELLKLRKAGKLTVTE